jgi:hypothetical protein
MGDVREFLPEGEELVDRALGDVGWHASGSSGCCSEAARRSLAHDDKDATKS